MEPLLHFVLPFVALYLFGEKPQTALQLAFLGVISDLDALFLIHRSMSHSLVIIGLIFIPFLIYAKYRRPELQRMIFLAFLVTMSHPILDLNGSVPLFWPLSAYSITLNLSLNGVFRNGLSLRPNVDITLTPTDFSLLPGFDYPLFTEEGLLIALVLLMPIIYVQLQKTRNSSYVSIE